MGGFSATLSTRHFERWTGTLGNCGIVHLAVQMSSGMDLQKELAESRGQPLAERQDLLKRLGSRVERERLAAEEENRQRVEMQTLAAEAEAAQKEADAAAERAASSKERAASSAAALAAAQMAGGGGGGGIKK
jgi:hypothetical protein